MRMVIRFTARTSLVLFCLAFSAAALARMWPNAWTRWLRRNRRYLGVSFAASHAIHAVAIACLRRDGSRRLCGGDLDRVLYLRRHRLRLHHRDDRDLVRPHRAAIGARAWRRLHLIGGYYLLFQFTVSFGKRIPDMPLYALFLIPLVAVFALRMIAMAPRAASGARGMT